MFLLRLTRAIAGLALVALLFAACSGDSLTDFAIDQASGDDVDFDFDSDGFAVTGEDGDVTVDFDGDGGFTFNDGDNAGSVQIDDDGNIVIQSDEGDATFSINSDDGVGTFSSDEGSGFASQAVPEGWPAFFGVPETLVESQSFFGIFEDASGTSYNANLTHDPAEDFLGAVEARLEAAGFQRIVIEGVTLTGGSQWEGQGLSINVSTSEGTTFILAGPA